VKAKGHLVRVMRSYYYNAYRNFSSYGKRKECHDIMKQYVRRLKLWKERHKSLLKTVELLFVMYICNCIVENDGDVNWDLIS